jgi:hypothetical protein
MLFAEYEPIGGSIAFVGLCLSISAYYCVYELTKSRRAQIEADLKREMIQKGMPSEEIERVLKATAIPPG